MTFRWFPILAFVALLAAGSACANSGDPGNDPLPQDTGEAFDLEAFMAETDPVQIAEQDVAGMDQGDAGEEIILLHLAQAPQIQSAAKSKGLWQRIKSGFTLPELHSPFTATHESWYAARPDYVKRMVDRSQKYLYHIVQEVERRGMPTEIALLPMVESAFNPQAYSRSKASGIWQFIPSTGKHYGLKQDGLVDNRRNITAATDAALNYLQKLHVMFGSWELALAAYNAGEGTVMRAIERNRKKGLPTDYQHLRLPDETRNYVPKLQAVKNIMSNPGQYGLDLQPIPNQPYFTAVQLPTQMDARLAAKLAGISYEEFRSLNPEYKRPVLTSASGNPQILLPIGADQVLTSALSGYSQPLVQWKTYTPKRGEQQEAIARKFGINLAQLRDINGLPQRGRHKSPQMLLVPADDAPGGAVPEVREPATVQPSGRTPLTHYVVRRGDTLFDVARRHHVAVRDLQRWNGLKSSRLTPGHKLRIRNSGND